jgi:hypothetical protein
MNSRSLFLSVSARLLLAHVHFIRRGRKAALTMQNFCLKLPIAEKPLLRWQVDAAAAADALQQINRCSRLRGS